MVVEWKTCCYLTEATLIVVAAAIAAAAFVVVAAAIAAVVVVVAGGAAAMGWSKVPSSYLTCDLTCFSLVLGPFVHSVQ